VQSDVAVAVNAALRQAGIEIPVPQRIVHLEQNDATRHSLGEHRAASEGNSPPPGSESIARKSTATPSSGQRSKPNWSRS